MTYSNDELFAMIKGDKEFPQGNYVPINGRAVFNPDFTTFFDNKIDFNAISHGVTFLEGLQEQGTSTETIQGYAESLREVQTRAAFYEQIQTIAAQENVNASQILGFDVDNRITQEKQREEDKSSPPLDYFTDYVPQSSPITAEQIQEAIDGKPPKKFTVGGQEMTLVSHEKLGPALGGSKSQGWAQGN